MLEVLGRGGFGTVYRAELLGAGGFAKMVALKLLHPHVESDARVLGRLRDEARMLGLLRHRAIVQVDGIVQLDGRQAVVMEYVPGISLDAAVRRCGPLAPGVALRVIEEVADALAFAFEATGHGGLPLRLMHRDVKPGNIQISPTGDVKLLDFGVARADFAGREATTQSLVYGSIPYLAPERLLRQDGPEADVFSLGATLAEVLGGRLRGGVPDSPEAHLARIAPAIERAGNTAVQELLGAALAWEPADRPSARELARRCRQIARELPGDLREWAEREIGAETPPSGPIEHDPLVGQVLVEQPLALPRGAQSTFDDNTLLGSAPPLTQEVPPLTDEVPPPVPEDPRPAVQAPPEPAVRPAPTPAPVRRAATPPPAPRRAPARPKTTALGLLGRLAFWLGVSTLVASALAAVVVALMGAAGVAGVFGLVAWAWPGAVAQSCVETFDEAEARLRVAKAGRAAQQASEHLVQHAAADCRAGRIGIMDSAAFSNRVDGVLADGVVTDLEARDLVVLYDQIARP